MKKVVFIAITFIAAFALNLKSQPGAAMNFDGVDDQVRFPGSTMGAFTIEFWMRTTQTGQTGTQWYQGNGIVDSEVGGAQNDYGVSLLGNKIAFGTGNPDVTITSTTAVNTGNWVHVAAMFTSNPNGVMWLYINGVLEAYQDPGVSSNARNTNANLCTGSIQTNVRYFNGDIDEVRLWNYVIPNCVLQSRMNCELTLPQSGLLRYYQFNQGLASANNTSITSLTNLVGGNNGNIINMALNGSSSNFISPGAVISGFSCQLPIINVNGNGNNISDGATSTSTTNLTSFSPMCTNSVPKTHIYTIQNTGTAALTIGTPSITGTNASLFSVTALPPSSIAPASSGTFAVTFTTSTAGGKSATISFPTNDCYHLNYDFVLGATVYGAPTISVNSGSICSGNSFVITPTGATNYTFSGGSATVSPNATTNYTVIGIDAQGCYNSNIATSTVTVVSTPTITVNSGAICSGQSFTMTPGGATTYTFSSGTAIVSPAVNTSYSVTGSNNSCVSLNTAIANVTVNTTPTITAAVVNNTICSGDSNTLTATGSTNYTWTPGNMIGNSVVVSPTANTTYTVFGADASCSSTKTISIVVNALPNVNITGASSLCIGNSVILTGTGATTYTWNTSATTNTISVAPTVNTTYTVTGTNVNGCQKTFTKTITVNAIPTISAASGTICSGKSFTIVASGANTYTYSGGSAIVSPTINTTYSVTGTSAQGCVASNTALSTVTVNPSPTISVTNSALSICNGQAVTFTVNGANSYSWSTTSTATSIVVSPTVNTTYTVIGTDLNGCQNTVSKTVTVSVTPTITSSSGSICSGNSFTISASGAATYTYSGGSSVVSPTATTSYSITGTNAQGCVSGNTSISTVSVNAAPLVNISSDTPVLCVGQFAILTASGANNYVWNTSATTSSIIVAPFSTTNYTVTGTNLAGCSANFVFTQNVTICTGLEPKKTNSVKLFVYPNPNSGNFTIESSEKIKVDLLDMTGKKMLSQDLSEGINTIAINEFANGVYILKTNKGDYLKIIKY
ncbi:MAG: LamG-like jellyroll fold domain-containing protein [Bacteroidota bacterium]|nr:LamG-like jellyroll fold domain-containing protein [Bacteroidota bacterium]